MDELETLENLMKRLDIQVKYAESQLEQLPSGTPMHSYYSGMFEAYNDCLQAVENLFPL